MGSEASKPSSKTPTPDSSAIGRRLSSGDLSKRSSNNSPLPTNKTNGGGSARSTPLGLPPAIKVGASISCNENLLNAGIPQQMDSKLSIDASRSRSGSASSNKQQKRPTMALKSRQLIQSCFQNPHENLGRRILKRTAEKRKDFGKFYVGLNSEQKDDVEETIKTFLKKSVANMEFMDEVQRLAEEFGERFVQYRLLAFKADYFACIADATITECVFLDNAVHPAHLTLSAFSQFITALFSSVRDGFYNEMRRLRRTSNSFSTGSNGSARRQKKPSIDSNSREASPRSGSPGADSSSPNSAASSDDSLHLQAHPAPEPSVTPVDERTLMEAIVPSLSEIMEPVSATKDEIVEEEVIEPEAIKPAEEDPLDNNNVPPTVVETKAESRVEQGESDGMPKLPVSLG